MAGHNQVPCHLLTTNSKTMATQLLPDNDKDLQLARQIGSYLDGQLELETVEDPLIPMLLGYKNERKQRSYADSSVSVVSNQVWRQIEEQTDTGKQGARVYQLGRSKTRAIWTTAAAILIAAFLGIYYFMNQQPQMVASSNQQIQTVQLIDGSKVTLRPHSAIYALTQSSQEQTYRLDGEAYFEVSPDPQRTFSVQAGNGKVSVLGTKFDLSSWGEQTQVYLEEGSIRFENLTTKDAVTLSPGESAAIGNDNTISTASTEITEFTDWMNRELIFKNKTVRYVLNELEQEFNFTFMAPDSIMETTLSGGLSLDNAQQSLDDLSLVLDGKFVKDAENRYRFVPNQ